MQAVARQAAAAIVVRLGSLRRASQAQLDGFKSRALRVQAPTQRHQYLTEWRLLDIATERLGVVLVLGTAMYTTRHERLALWASLHELAAYPNSNMCMATAISLQSNCEHHKPFPLCDLEAALSFMQMFSTIGPTAVWLPVCPISLTSVVGASEQPLFREDGYVGTEGLDNLA